MRSGSCPRQQTPPMVVCRSKNRVSSILLPVVLAMMLLPAIAFASPPDPSWIAGIYDGVDRDDIVNLVYETWAASAAGSSHIGPLPSMSGILIERITPRLPGSQFAQGPRAPPAVGSKVPVHGFTFRACSTLTASCTKLPLLPRRSPGSEFGQEDGRKIADVFPTRASINDRIHLVRDADPMTRPQCRQESPSGSRFFNGCGARPGRWIRWALHL